MITLYGFGKRLGLIDPSPFVLKIDIYLRMCGLPFETKSSISNLRIAPKGKLPFIQDNGKIIADSSFIIDYLKVHYGDHLDAHLNAEERAFVYLIGKSLDENLYWCLVYARWYDEQGWQQMKKGLFGRLSFPVKQIAAFIARRKVKKALKMQGIANHSSTEVKQITQASLANLSVLLANKRFILGDKICSLDATVFAFLAAYILSDLDTEFSQIVLAYPNLVDYCQRIHQTYYSM